MYAIILAALLSFQTSSVQGTWVNIDDETGVEKSEITLYVENGKLYGKIERLLLPEDQGKVCEKCKGKEKNQPIEISELKSICLYLKSNWIKPDDK